MGAHGAHVSNQGHFPFRLFGNNFKHFLTFSAALHKGFAGGAADVQAVHALRDIELHQLAQALGIQLLLVIKRCKKSGHNPFQRN